MGASRRTFLAFAGAASAALGSKVAPALAAVQRVPLLSTYVVGSDRYEAPTAVGALAPGDLVRLAREPTNGYDSRAVAVFLSGRAKLGYVPRIHNEALANLIDAGFAIEARVKRIGGRPERPDIALMVSLLPEGSVAGMTHDFA
jgi:hypothetical protein